MKLGYWVAGDDAYEQSNFMCTPYSSSAALKHMTPEERKEEMLKRDGYNFWQSSLRIAIECAFGMLIRRFGIFWRSMTGTLP